MSFSSEEARILGNSLREATRKRGLTCASLARQTGVDPSRISRIFGGKFATKNPTLVLICKYLGVPAGLADHNDPAARIAASALGIWDGTAEDAEQVVQLLNQIATVRQRR